MTTQEMERLLPEACYVYVPTTGGIGMVRRGEQGYRPVALLTPPSPLAPSGKSDGELLAAQKNAKLGVTKVQAAAMSAGSMFGWHVPAADPRNYDPLTGNLRRRASRSDPER